MGGWEAVFQGSELLAGFALLFLGGGAGVFTLLKGDAPRYPWNHSSQRQKKEVSARVGSRATQGIKHSKILTCQREIENVVEVEDLVTSIFWKNYEVIHT